MSKHVDPSQESHSNSVQLPSESDASSADHARSSEASKSHEMALSSLDSKELLSRLKELAETLRGFEAFQQTSQGERFMSLRQQSLALIEQKLLPELEANLKLPLFVCIVGGTNTGKSTLFNALAGVILSESKVTASATKHPLVYAHKRWEKITMKGRLFSTPRLLESPGQLLMKGESDETFMTFHDRKELQDIAFIDCPDFDSIDEENAQVAYRIVNQADLCIFVTSPQKYKDAVLISALKEILSQQKQVFVLFNLTDDEMLYRTMVADLSEELDGNTLNFGSYFETVTTHSPERTLQERSSEMLKGFLSDKPREIIKRTLLQHNLKTLVDRSQSIVSAYRDQTERKDELLHQMENHLREAMRTYESEFALTFPEIGAALTEQMTQVELQRIFKPKAPTLPNPNPQWTTFLSHGFGLAGQRLRRAFVKSFDFGEPPKNWETFWRQRDEQDLAHIKQRAQLLRASIEQTLRISSQESAVSQLLLERFFTAEQLRIFDGRFESLFWENLKDEISLGQEILQQSEQLNQREGGFLLSSAAWMANLIKGVLGFSLSWVTGGLGLWDILLFFPLGFISGAYGITWLLYWRLRHKEALFKEQRVRFSAQLFKKVQIQPLRECVEQMASEKELDDLTKLSDRLKQST